MKAVMKLRLPFAFPASVGRSSGLLSSMYLGEITTLYRKGNGVSGGSRRKSRDRRNQSVLRGRGNVIPGTFAGVLLLIVISNGLGTRGVSPYVYPFVAGVIIFFAIYLDSLKNSRPLARY